MRALENFSKVKVLIVGDVMLDRYWWGQVSRISPEAPVPVVNLENTSLSVGGAANVAANVAGLGAQAFLVGVVGDDDDARLFPNLLNESNVSADFLIKIPTRRTTVKTRVIAHSQQVVRVDQETKQSLSSKEEEKVWNAAKNLIKNTDAVIISDYAKGVLTKNLLKRLITTAKAENKFILVDPKGKDFSKYRGASVLTPNQKEAVEACGLEEASESAVEKSGIELLKKLSLEAVLITQGEKGMRLFQKNRETTHLNSLARKVYDVTGAGDTVIAGLAVASAAGMNFYEAAKLANIAAGLVVEQIGTTAISIEMLRASLADENISTYN